MPTQVRTLERVRGTLTPFHTVVVGHCGTHLASNVQTFTTFGLNTKEAHALLRETVALSVKLGWQIWDP